MPTNALELALWMESDRMGYLLPALTDAKFENQREVVLNERRQNYENRPYGFAGMAIMSALYPPTHPYHWLTIGAADDLRAARLDDVRAFFQTYYRPRNASLALAGDVDTEIGRSRSRRDISASSKPAMRRRRCRSDRAAAVHDRDVRLLLEDRVELPRLYIAWHSPALFGEDDAELDLVAEVLASGKTSRLYRSARVRRSAWRPRSPPRRTRARSAAIFQIVATAAPGRQGVGEQDGTPFSGRGMKSLQFVRTGEGWRISAAAWDDER